VMVICLEVVTVGVELDKEAVRKDSHARDDAKNSVSDGLLDQEAVGNVGSIGEIELKIRWVDESNLCSSNLRFILAYNTSA